METNKDASETLFFSSLNIEKEEKNVFKRGLLYEQEKSIMVFRHSHDLKTRIYSRGRQIKKIIRKNLKLNES